MFLTGEINFCSGTTFALGTLGEFFNSTLSQGFFFSGRLIKRLSSLLKFTAWLICCRFLVQLITGYAIPNNAQAFLLSTSLGSWAIDGYADNYVQDQKMAHYCKIAPRAVFRSQVSTIVISCFVAVAMQNWMMSNIQGLCTISQSARFTCVSDDEIVELWESADGNLGELCHSYLYKFINLGIDWS